MGGNQSQSSSTHSLTNTSSFKVAGKSHPIFSPSLLCSSRSPGVACDTYIGTNHRSRRFHSTDRAQKVAIVKKSDISCPFRCSRKDLNTSGYESNATENSLKAPNSFFANNSVLNVGPILKPLFMNKILNSYILEAFPWSANPFSELHFE